MYFVTKLVCSFNLDCEKSILYVYTGSEDEIPMVVKQGPGEGWAADCHFKL